MSSTPAKAEDARIVKSRNALQEALLRLILRGPFEQITIREITTEAGVSYPTFFRHFSSKEKLLEYIATEEVHRLLTLAQPVFEQDSLAALTIQCEYVQQHRALWTTLLTEGASSIMREEFLRVAREIGLRREETGKLSNPSFPRDLAAPFGASGMFEIFSWWLTAAGLPVGAHCSVSECVGRSASSAPFSTDLAKNA